MSIVYSDFADQHIFVTGAGGGIGRATALAFAAQGARVSALDIKQDGLDETAAGGPNITSYLCDLTDDEAVRTTYATALSAHGDIKALVNNAGVDRRIALEEQSMDSWRWMMSVNLNHHAHLSHLAADSLARSGAGAIVNLSSTAWMKLASNLTAYHAAKAGIVGLTCGLARDLGKTGVRANAIAPGRVVIERSEADVTPEWIAATHELQCLPKLISAKNIADTVLWLCSDASEMVTGQTIVVDGGVV